MKMTTLKSVAIAVGLASSAFGQATSPVVGYETQVLRPGEFNLFGVRLFNQAEVTGTFTGSTATTLTDANADFSSLDAATMYTIEFASGSSIVGVPGASFAGTTVSDVSGVDASFETGYVVRESATISSVFGADNSAGLLASAAADPSAADLVFIPQPDGSFVTVFFSTFADDPNFAGWLNSSTFEQVPDLVLDTDSGLFIQTQPTSSPSVVTSGAVKTLPSSITVDQPFSLVGTSYPAGATLESSGMEAFLQSSVNADPTEADVVFIPNPDGSFSQAFFSSFVGDDSFAGWLDSSSFAQVPDRPLTPAILIQQRGPDVTGVNTPPAFFANL